MNEEQKARLAILGAMIFTLLEALPVATVQKIQAILLLHQSNFSASDDPVFDECVKAEFERFISATDDILANAGV